MSTLFKIKKIVYISILIIVVCVFGSNIFAGGADNEIINSLDIMTENILSGTPARVLVLFGKEDIVTPYDDLLDPTPYAPIKKITKPMIFPEDLFVTEYNKLLRERLKKEYPDTFNNKTIDEYFFKALAEATYSHDGYLDSKYFNDTVNGRTIFYRIANHIKTMKFKPLVEKAVLYIYLQQTVYLRNIKNPKKAILKLSKIPKDPILYIIDPPDFLLSKINKIEEAKEKSSSKKKKRKDSDSDPYSGESRTSLSNTDLEYSIATDIEGNALPGDFLNFPLGNNLYFICSTYFEKFPNFPPEIQLKILDNIFSFNISLTEARPVRADNTLVSYLRMQFLSLKQDSFLKYRLKESNTWLLLPQNLDQYKNLKVDINND